MKDVQLLVHKAQEGSIQAFESLVRQFQDMVFTLAYVKVRDESLAEDIAQETFIETYLHLRSLRQPGAFAGWLRQIALHQCCRVHRRKSVEMVSLDQAFDVPVQDANPVDRVLHTEARQVLRETIESLPEHQCTAIFLHYISGYSQIEIAAFLDVPVHTIRKRIQHAREQLKEKIITMKEDYFERRPSKDETFSRRIRFFVAVQSGNISEVRSLLDEDPTLITARQKYSETMMQLLPVRTRPNEDHLKSRDDRGQEGWTPLLWAARHGNVEMAELLLEKGALVTETWNNTSVLRSAVLEGYPKVVALLLEHGADPNNQECDKLISPLHTAVCMGWREVVELLVNHGADIERLDHAETREASLSWAAISGNLDIVLFLLEHGAKTDAVDHIGWTALKWAEHSGHVAVTQMLKRYEEGMKGEILETTGETINEYART